MSVRRLAEDQVQPAGFAFSRENMSWAKATIKKYPKGREQSAVILLLMRAQEQDGWVTKAAIEAVADMLGMAYIRVLEVATFYTQFQLKPVGTRAHVQVCGTTPCMLRGSEDLLDVCRKKIHHDPLHLNAEGTLSWEEVECQGACVNAPMVMIFKDSYEDLTPRQLEYIIERFEAGKGFEVKPGPQIDRIFSAPIDGPTTLLDVPPVAKPAKKPGLSKTTAVMPGDVKPVEAAKPTEIKPAEVVDPMKAEKPLKAAKPAKPSLDDKNRPAPMEKPAVVDDLKMVSGVGPKIEAILNGLGIYSFGQVAAWSAPERQWVDEYLSFAGRIERDDWQKQAAVLASGGVAEYIKVFGKKPR